MEAVLCEISTNFELLVIVINLTENGLEYYEDVLKIIFQYAEMLRSEGPQESIFKEVMIYYFINYIYYFLCNVNSVAGSPRNLAENPATHQFAHVVLRGMKGDAKRFGDVAYRHGRPPE